MLSVSNADEILLTASPKIGPAAPTLEIDWFKDEDQNKNVLDLLFFFIIDYLRTTAANFFMIIQYYHVDVLISFKKAVL